ncbi:hypothetical protein EVAR_57121_1 [Eumeta japonica]|uniref:Uncharacterized protein n=1 Tax=Eumeta variegata TaxID=151549 RepID=A0A4C1YVG3_EUMVA|nr:hypothetical protein EVAR_57121_1 [Eumeta japonica]
MGNVGLHPCTQKGALPAQVQVRRADGRRGGSWEGAAVTSSTAATLIELSKSDVCHTLMAGWIVFGPLLTSMAKKDQNSWTGIGPDIGTRIDIDNRTVVF